MSTTPAQLTSVVRFSLSNLKAKNSHHEFEHLCRHLTRLRIYSNVIPATGPVSAGGDAGRDFETFRTSLNSPIVANSEFARLSSGSRDIACACSLQEKVTPKIKTDVRAIVAGEPCDEILYFCEEDIPIGKRNALKKWAQKGHKVELRIFDGTAISELLVDRETFWIAEEYLHLPSDLSDALIDTDSEFETLHKRWSNRIPLLHSQADFFEIKRALRHATFHVETRPRLGFWLAKMALFAVETSPLALRRRAQYEVAVATFRGRGEMTTQLPAMREYYHDFQVRGDAADLQDAATLCVYAFGAWSFGQLDVEPAELLVWRSSIATFLDDQIAHAKQPGQLATLLRIRGYLCVLPESEGSPPPLDAGFDYWDAMLAQSERTPLFPIADFADFIRKSLPVLGRHSRLPSFLEKMDALLARQGGNEAVGEKIFERALAYYEADDLLSAVRELHRVQLKWFSGDAMPKFQRAMWLLSKCYLELQMPFAAKYQALAAALNAQYSTEPEVAHSLPEMLFAAVDAEDAAGNSLGFLQLFLVAIAAHCQFEHDPLDLEKHPNLQAHLGQAAALRGIALRVDQSILKSVDGALSKWPPLLRDAAVEASVDKSGFWQSDDLDLLWTGIQDSFIYRPLADATSQRTLEWRALGVLWSVSYANTYDVVPSAERFLAQLQIAQVVLAEFEQALLPTTVHLELVIRAGVRRTSCETAQRKDAHGAHLRIVLPKARADTASGKKTVDVVAAILAIIRAISTLPDEELLGSLKGPALTIAGRAFVGRAYETLYTNFMPRELFAPSARTVPTRFWADRDFVPHEHVLLPWRCAPGPTYTEEIARISIEGRYARGLKVLQYTLPRLISCPRIAAHIVSLRVDGLKDWEILARLTNAAINIRHPIADDAEMTQEIVDQFRAALEVEEALETSLSPDEFTDDLLEAVGGTFLGAFLGGWGLQMPPVSDNDALERFLKARYGLRMDDVPHDEIFPTALMSKDGELGKSDA